jgi:hypothetical protein
MTCRTSILILAMTCGLLLTLGCSGHGPASHDSSGGEADHPVDEAPQATTTAPIETTPEVEAKLALADAVDGNEDHVVSRCGGCSLAMDGSSDHAVVVGDYEMHFCSDSCKGHFEDNTIDAILAMAVPQP